jgi:ribonuclease T2
MKWLKIVAVAAAFALASLGSAQAQMYKNLGPATPGDFSFYVLALTWAPDYCATAESPDQQECNANPGFLLHGLWPQDANGYPSACTDVPLPADVRAQYAGIFAAPSLIDHEWPKHGTCSGLSPADFFAKTQNVLASITIPDQYKTAEQVSFSDASQIAAAFYQANPSLPQGSVEVIEDRRNPGQVEELDICLDKTGAGIACP